MWMVGKMVFVKAKAGDPYNIHYAVERKVA
jgi:hypothetical protein